MFFKGSCKIHEGGESGSSRTGGKERGICRGRIPRIEKFLQSFKLRAILEKFATRSMTRYFGLNNIVEGVCKKEVAESCVKMMRKIANVSCQLSVHRSNDKQEM